MSARPDAPAPPVLLARRLHGLLLRLYPAGFRRRFGDQMRRDLADLARQAYRRDGLAGLASLHVQILGDVLRSAWGEHRGGAGRGSRNVAPGRGHRRDAPPAGTGASMAGDGSLGEVGGRRSGGSDSVGRRSRGSDSVDRGSGSSGSGGSSGGRGSAGRDTGGELVGGLVRDVSFAVRTLARSPGFTAVAVITLALGIGANAAIFSLVDGVLLQPLPWPDGDELVLLRKSHPRLGFNRMSVQAAEFRGWRERVPGLEALSGFTFESAHVSGGDEPRRLSTALVLPDLLGVLGLEPVEGRAFTAAEFEPGHERVVIVGPAVWRSHFGSAAAAVGRDLRLDGEPHRIVGALGPGGELPSTDAQIVLPATLTTEEWTDPSGGRFWFIGVGRLAPGVRVEDVRSRLDGLIEEWDAEDPGPLAGWTSSVVTLREEMVGEVEDALLTFFGAVLLVLLIACANVANLLIARGTARHREMAVRAALGAGRGRLVRQLLTESVLLAVLGCAAGMLLAFGAVEALVRVGPASLPGLGQVGVDLRVAGFAAGTTVVATLLFGLLPALGVARRDLARGLATAGGRGSTSSRARGWSRNLLSVAEVALAVVLLVGSGLLLRSVAGLLAVDPGFEAERAVRMQVVLAEFRYPSSVARTTAVEAILDRVRGLGGVEQAAASNWMPMSGSWSQRTVRADGAGPADPDDPPPFTYTWSVTPGYFEAMGIDLLRGRGFTRSDSADAEPVAVVTEAMGRRLWPDQDPLGRRLTFDTSAEEPPWLRVVGIASDVRARGLDSDVSPGIYLPWGQSCCSSVVEVVARTDVAPGEIAGSLRQQVWDVDDQIPILAIDGLASLRAAQLAQPRFQLGVLGAMAAVALLLAAVGVYGVVSYAVGARTREFGVRMAVGARAADVVGLVARQGGALLGAGLGLGLLLAVGVTRLMESLLFRVSPTDPATFAGVSLFLALVGALATLVPARRATRVDPVEALARDP